MRNIISYILIAVAVVACNKQSRQIPFGVAFDYQDGKFVAIDSILHDTIVAKNGDRLISDTINFEIGFSDEPFFQMLCDKHRDLIRVDTLGYNDITQVAPLYEDVFVKDDTLIRNIHIATELYESIKFGMVVGEISNQRIDTVIDKETEGWSRKNNLSANVKLSYERDWWGTPRFQWKTTIANISNHAWDKSLTINIECFNEQNDLIGTATAFVGDYLAPNETMSKAYFFEDYRDLRLNAAYLRLYIDDVYYGEFVNIL